METRVKPARVNFLQCSLFNIIIVLPLLFIMLIYQSIISLYLKVKHGTRYVGLMKTWDAMNFLNEHPEAPNIPFVVFEIEANKCDINGMDQTLLDTVREGFDRNIKNNRRLEKLTYSKHAKVGYAFWMKMKNFDIKNHVKRIELKEGQTVEEYYQKIVSENMTGVWELLICDRVSGEDGKLYMIFRFHHALGDALSIFQLLVTCILTSEGKKDNFVIKNPTSHLRKALMIWMWPHYVSKYQAFSKHTSVIHPSILSNDKSVVWKFDKNKTVLKVKYVKKCISGLKFLDVVHTALSVALYKYIEKYKGMDKIPNFIYMATAKELPGTSFNVQEKFDLEASTIIDALTLKLISPDLPVKEKLDTVSKYLIENKPGVDYALYSFTKILSPLICPMAKGGVTRFEIITSNLPGFSQLRLDGREITNVAFAPNNIFNTGLTMGIKSYGDQLNLALIFDKSVLGTEEEGREILDNIYCEIENMFKIMCSEHV